MFQGSDQQGVDRPDADRRFGKNSEAVAEVRSEGVSTSDSIITRPSANQRHKGKRKRGCKVRAVSVDYWGALDRLVGTAICHRPP